MEQKFMVDNSFKLRSTNALQVIMEEKLLGHGIKVYPKAGQFQNKSFSTFESLCFMWAKDRAIGEQGKSLGGMEHEVNLKDDDHPESPQIFATDVDFSQRTGETAPTTNHINNSLFCPEKKYRLNNFEVITEVLRETVTSLDKTIVSVFEKLGNQMSS